jgi:hypothetical protein
MPGKKFINIYNQNEHKTANQLRDSNAYEVIHEITKSHSLSPAEKWKIIYTFTQSSMTVGEVRECLRIDE